MNGAGHRWHALGHEQDGGDAMQMCASYAGYLGEPRVSEWRPVAPALSLAHLLCGL